MYIVLQVPLGETLVVRQGREKEIAIIGCVYTTLFTLCTNPCTTHTASVEQGERERTELSSYYPCDMMTTTSTTRMGAPWLRLLATWKGVASQTAGSHLHNVHMALGYFHISSAKVRT